MANPFKRTTDLVTKKVGFALLQLIERIFARYSLHGTPTFFNNDDFAWTQILEDNWAAIRNELDEVVLKHRERLPNFQEISEDQTAITNDDDWKTFFLYGFGHKAEKNAARCPKTTEIIEQIPGMKTGFFSILSPGKHIPSHRGPYKGVIRVHLGLKVPGPKEQCRIRVGNDYRHWEEGEVMLFDDTHDHEVWNDTDGERVVLFLDVVRPLAPPLDRINRTVISLIGKSPFVQNAKKNQEQWERKLESDVGPASVLA